MQEKLENNIAYFNLSARCKTIIKCLSFSKLKIINKCILVQSFSRPLRRPKGAVMRMKMQFFSTILFKSLQLVWRIILMGQRSVRPNHSSSQQSTGLAAQTSPELIFHIINMSQDSSVSLSVSCTQSSPSSASVLGEYQTFSLSFTIFLRSIVLTNCCYFSGDNGYRIVIEYRRVASVTNSKVFCLPKGHST